MPGVDGREEGCPLVAASDVHTAQGGPSSLDSAWSGLAAFLGLSLGLTSVTSVTAYCTGSGSSPLTAAFASPVAPVLPLPPPARALSLCHPVGHPT